VHDLRAALKSLSGAKRLAAVIVVSLALGTGANAAVYSALDALLFRPPPGVSDPATLADIYTSQVNGGTFGHSSFLDFLSLSNAPSLRGIAGVEERDDQAVRFGETTVSARVAGVTEQFWSVIGMSGASDDWARGAVLSEDLWRLFGSDPQIVGRAVSVNGETYHVVAVAPRGFRGLHLDRLTHIWIPLGAGATRGRGERTLRLVGRLTAPARLADLQSELRDVAARLAREYPETNLGTVRNEEEPRRITATAYARLEPAVRSRAALFGAALLGATVLLLISACVNAGSLLLSRGIARRTELTIKLALGADRGRLVRQVIFEGLLLALAGSVAGLIAAGWTAGALPALFAPEHASLLDTRIERPVIAATLGVGLLAGLLFALAPALVATRGLAPTALRGDASRLGERQGAARLRLALVGAQLALSTTFLIASALLGRLADASLGVDRSISDVPPTLAWVETYDRDYRQATMPRLKAVPSVARVGWVAVPPLGRTVRREYRFERGATRESIDLDVNFASAEYFSVMSIPLIEGRHFRAQDDRNGVDVAVVNEALAQRYFAGRAVGRVLTDPSGRTVEIVGVVLTRSYRAFEGAQRPLIYFPMSRATSRGFYAVIRGNTGATTLERDVTAALEAAGGATNLEVTRFDAFVQRALAPDRLVGRLVAACGALSLGLAVVGVYGVMSDAARRRRREFGLRAALGATPSHIVRALLGGSLGPALGGVAGGIASAFFLARVARSIVFGLPPIDPSLLGAIVTLMLVVVMASVAAPIRQALRVSPLVALRD
jgi:putative ABC transport system permease protein